MTSVVIARCHATKFMHFIILADFGKWFLVDLPLFSNDGKWTGNQIPGPSLFPLAKTVAMHVAHGLGGGMKAAYTPIFLKFTFLCLDTHA